MTIDTLNHQLVVEKTALGGVLLITPNTIFDDFRGDYVEIYHESLYKNSENIYSFLPKKTSRAFDEWKKLTD